MDFWLSIATWIALYGLLALGLNIQFGYAGLLNFGYVAFFSWGAFTSALISLKPPEPVDLYAIGLGAPVYPFALMTAAVAGGLLALMIGLMCGRLSEHYLAIATFAVAEISHTILVNEVWLSGGQFGITTVPQPGKGNVIPVAFYQSFLAILTAGVCVGVFFCLLQMTRRGFGRLLRAIRDDPIAAQAFGKNILTSRLKALTIGGLIAGLGGSLWTHSLGVVHVGQFIPIVTFQIWLAVLLGGRGNHWGVLVGTALVILWREGTRFLDGFFTQVPEFLPSLRYIFIGLMVIVVIRLMPQGVFPETLSPVPERKSARSKRRRLALSDVPSLTASEIAKSYQGWPVLRDVSFSLRQGTITGLIGDNGAGKSTLIDIISGFTYPDRGRILAFDADITHTSPHSKNRSGLVRTFQTARLFESMNVWDNLLLAGGTTANEGCLKFWADESELEARAWQTLEIVPLSPGQRVETLSGGQRKLLTLAMALMTQSPLILLDEPTAGVHPTLIPSLIQTLQTLQSRNHTLLIVEHNREVIETLCHQVLILRDGRLESYAAA